MGLIKEITCEICQDTGEVVTMDYVYAGEPYMAAIGIAPCECQRVVDED